jgi:hypothetical protein
MATEKISFDPRYAEDHYSVDAGHLANLRSRKEGPKFYRRGRRVYYKRDEFERWLFECPVQTKDSVTE